MLGAPSFLLVTVISLDRVGEILKFRLAKGGERSSTRVHWFSRGALRELCARDKHTVSAGLGGRDLGECVSLVNFPRENQAQRRSRLLFRRVWQ